MDEVTVTMNPHSVKVGDLLNISGGFGGVYEVSAVKGCELTLCRPSFWRLVLDEVRGIYIKLRWWAEDAWIDLCDRISELTKETGQE